MNTASHLCMPTFSFKKKIDNTVTIIGDTNAKVNASANDIIDMAKKKKTVDKNKKKLLHN